MSRVEDNRELPLLSRSAIVRCCYGRVSSLCFLSDALMEEYFIPARD